MEHQTKENTQSDVTKTPSIDFFDPIPGPSHTGEQGHLQESLLVGRDKEMEDISHDPQDNILDDQQVLEVHPSNQDQDYSFLLHYHYGQHRQP